MPIEDVDKVLRESMSGAVFYTRGPRCGLVEVGFSETNSAWRDSMKDQRAAEWMICPTFFGEGVANVEIGWSAHRDAVGVAGSGSPGGSSGGCWNCAGFENPAGELVGA